MARPSRVEFPGALYYVTSRAAVDGVLFADSEDRSRFITILGEACHLFNLKVHAWCLLDDHYHLLLETPDGNLSRGMRYLNGVYTQRYQLRHGKKGSLFQGRFKAIIIDRKPYYQRLIRHIVLNPVRIGKVDKAKGWRWSSHRTLLDLTPVPIWFPRKTVLKEFGKPKKDALKRYKRFIAASNTEPTPWGDLKKQIYLGSSDFIAKTEAMVAAGALPQRSHNQQRPPPLSLSKYEKRAANRNEAIVMAYTSGGYRLHEIGEHFSLHYSTVSRIVHQGIQTTPPKS
ncbi:MAG: transposase [Gammaproteobacteria bacterium]|nr:transposase [Gammaproteobacteria bacterium]